MLWSDRGPEQGAGSLRQALRQTRAALGPHRDLVRADRQRVMLDRSRLEVLSDGPDELAEGLDVRDPEFEDWLRQERASRNAARAEEPESRAGQILSRRPAVPRPPMRARVEPETWLIHICAEPNPDIAVHWVGQLVADGIARNLREHLSHDVVRDDIARPEDGLSVVVDGFRETERRLGLRIRLAAGTAGQQYWSGFRQIPLRGAPAIDDPLTQQLMIEAEAAVELAIRDGYEPGDPDAIERDPDMLCRSAIRAIFSMVPERLLLADDLLRRASMLHPHAAYDAWRAQIRVIQEVERHPGDRQLFRQEGEHFAARAQESDPANALVTAIHANVEHFLLRNSPASLVLAERAVRLNPTSPMALWARSNARLYMGETEAAHRDAVHGRFLTQTSEFRFFWDLQQFATSMLRGQLEEATRLAQRVSAQCPIFRPPHRYLTALHAHHGHADRAAEQAEFLQRLEPDFSVDRLLNDRRYPASLIRRAPGLDTNRLADLS